MARRRAPPLQEWASEDPLAVEQFTADRISDLERENTAMREVLATVSHELKTPLTSVVAYCDLLLRNSATNLSPRQMDQLIAIRRNSDLLEVIANDLTRLLEVRQGRFPIVPSVVEARDLLEESAESMRPMFEGAGQSLGVISPTRGNHVRVDRSRLQQVIGNLLTNASKYSAPGSHVELVADVDESLFYLQVTDNGIGIPADELPHVFESFFRASTVIGEGSAGLGLGLHITKRIIEAHGGSISIKSEPGRGTIVSIALPRDRQTQD